VKSAFKTPASKVPLPERTHDLLEHVPNKLPGFFDKDMLQLFEIELRLIDQLFHLIGTHSRA
jgi:hypothetical protein